MSNKCQVNGCENNSKKIASDGTKYIEVCDSCWHKKYKS